MKRNIIKLVVLLGIMMLWMFNGINVCQAADKFINNFELLSDSKKDYKEIKELDSQIKAMINEYIILNDGERNKKKIEFDIKNAFKVHDASDIFSLPGDSMKDIEECVKNTDVVWVLFAKSGNKEFKVQIIRSESLNNNPWVIGSVESVTEKDVFKYEETIESEINKNDIDLKNKKIILCSGIKYMNSAVAIVGDKKAEAFIPTGEIDIEGTKEQVDAIKYDADIEKSYTFKYKKIKKAIILAEPDYSSLVGGVHPIVLTDQVLNDDEVVETKANDNNEEQTTEDIEGITGEQLTTSSMKTGMVSNIENYKVYFIILVTLVLVGIVGVVVFNKKRSR